MFKLRFFTLVCCGCLDLFFRSALLNAKADLPPSTSPSTAPSLVVAPEWADQRVTAELEKLADSGNARACTVLAWRCANAVGDVPADLTKATALRLKAAAKGDVRAMARLGAFDRRPGAPVRTDALTWLNKAADAGDPVALVILGNACLQGLDMPVDARKGHALYLQAAENGCAAAMVRLAKLYSADTPFVRDQMATIEWAGRAVSTATADAPSTHDTEDFMEVASLYGAGVGVAKDADEAKRWAAKAADAGDPQGMVALSVYIATNGAGDMPQALKWLRRAAGAQNADATRNLGIVALKGQGQPRDLDAGVKWIRQAADLGDPESMRVLALLYASGEAVAADPATAVQWMTRAADAGNLNAVKGLADIFIRGKLIARDDARATVLLRTAADRGDAEAMGQLGERMIGGIGVPRNVDDGVRWLRRAAEAGDSASMNNLGAHYMEGTGVERDPAEAARWYARAAEAGEPAAMNTLGQHYLDGIGVPKDPLAGVDWLRKAVQHGSDGAMFNLARAYVNGTGVAKNLEQAARLFKQAADRGNVGAMSRLGMMYESGDGVQQNAELGRKLITAAADRGDPDARHWLQQHNVTGS